MAFRYILSTCSGIYKIEILSIDSSVMKDINSIEQQFLHKNLDTQLTTNIIDHIKQQ